MRLSPKTEPVYFTWGKLVHTGCEQIRAGMTIEEIVEQLAAAIANNTAPEYAHVDANLLDQYLSRLERVLGAHLLKYPFDQELYESLGIEHKFSLPLKIPTSRGDETIAIFKGKIDDVVRQTKTGAIFSWETKTAAQTGDSYWVAKQFDSQPKGYLLAVQRVMGFQTTHTIYDVFKKPQLKLKKTETEEQLNQRIGEAYLLAPERYFERREISFTQEQIDQYYWELCNLAESIIWHKSHGIWIRHHPGNRVGGCQYAGICQDGEQSSRWSNYKHRGAMHPELVNV